MDEYNHRQWLVNEYSLANLINGSDRRGVTCLALVWENILSFTLWKLQRSSLDWLPDFLESIAWTRSKLNGCKQFESSAGLSEPIFQPIELANLVPLYIWRRSVFEHITCLEGIGRRFCQAGVPLLRCGQIKVNKRAEDSATGRWTRDCSIRRPLSHFWCVHSAECHSTLFW